MSILGITVSSRPVVRLTVGGGCSTCVRNPVYTAASVLTTFGGAAMFGSMLLFPLYFQVLRGTDVITAGLSPFSLGVGTKILLPVSGWLTDRYGRRNCRIGRKPVHCGDLFAVLLAEELPPAPSTRSSWRSGG